MPRTLRKATPAGNAEEATARKIISLSLLGIQKFMEGGKKNYRYAIEVGYADGRTITVFRELVNFIECVKALEKIFGDHNGVPIAPRLAMLGKSTTKSAMKDKYNQTKLFIEDLVSLESGQFLNAAPVAKMFTANFDDGAIFDPSDDEEEPPAVRGPPLPRAPKGSSSQTPPTSPLPGSSGPGGGGGGLAGVTAKKLGNKGPPPPRGASAPLGRGAPPPSRAAASGGKNPPRPPPTKAPSVSSGASIVLRGSGVERSKLANIGKSAIKPPPGAVKLPGGAGGGGGGGGGGDAQGKDPAFKVELKSTLSATKPSVPKAAEIKDPPFTVKLKSTTSVSKQTGRFEPKSTRKVKPPDSKPAPAGAKPKITSIKPKIGGKKPALSSSKPSLKKQASLGSVGSVVIKASSKGSAPAVSKSPGPQPPTGTGTLDGGRSVVCVVGGERKEFVLPAKFAKSPKFTEISPLLMGMLQSFDAVLNYADRDGDMVAIRDQDDLDLYLSELDATATLQFAISVEGDFSPYNTAY